MPRINIINPRTSFEAIFEHLAKKLGISFEGQDRLECLEKMQQHLEEMNDAVLREKAGAY